MQTKLFRLGTNSIVAAIAQAASGSYHMGVNDVDAATQGAVGCA